MSEETQSQLREIEASQLIAGNSIATLATSDEGIPLACAIFYVLLQDGTLGFKSRRYARHIVASAQSGAAALMVYSHASTYAEKWGVQLLGRIGPIADIERMSHVVAVYGTQFPGSALKLPSLDELVDPSTTSSFYWFKPQQFRLVAEDQAGVRTMVEMADATYLSSLIAGLGRRPAEQGTTGRSPTTAELALSPVFDGSVEVSDAIGRSTVEFVEVDLHYSTRIFRAVFSTMSNYDAQVIRAHAFEIQIAANEMIAPAAVVGVQAVTSW